MNNQIERKKKKKTHQMLLALENKEKVAVTFRIGTN